MNSLIKAGLTGVVALCALLPNLATAAIVSWRVEFDIKALDPTDHDEHASLIFSADSSSFQTGPTGYVITTVSGTLDGNAVQGIGVGAFPTGNDNLFNPFEPFFTASGVAFEELGGGGDTYKIFEEGGALKGCWGGDGCRVRVVENFVVPEPTSFALAGLALAVTGLSLRRRQAEIRRC